MRTLFLWSSNKELVPFSVFEDYPLKMNRFWLIQGKVLFGQRVRAREQIMKKTVRPEPA